MAVPTAHKALVQKQKGGNLVLETIKTYTPKSGEVLVRVEAVALNPADWKVREYGYRYNKYPVVLGLDAAGVVVKTGDNVTSLGVGDRIFYAGYLSDISLGTFQQYNIVPAAYASKVPPNLTFEEASTVPLTVTTAATGLYGPIEPLGGAGFTPPWLKEGRGKYAGQSIVVFGGSAAVGQGAIQLAKLSGFSPIITTVSDYNVNLVKSLGATHTIDRHLDPSEIIKAVKQITTDSIRFIWDAISIPDTENSAYDILAPGGILVLAGGNHVKKDKVTPDKKIITTLGTCYCPVNEQLGIDLCSHLTRLLETGDIKPNVFEVVPGGLSSIPEALERIKYNKISGMRLVVRPPDTP